MQSLAFDLASSAGQVPMESAAMPPVAAVAPPAANLNYRHRWQTFFSQQLSVFSVADQDYVLGVQIANLLNRETFNLYRSLKIKGIELIRAEPSHVEYLVACNSIRRGTHSVTLIRLADAINFVEGEHKRGFREQPRVAIKGGKRKLLSSSTGSLVEDEELEMSGSDGASTVLLTASADGRRPPPGAWHLLLRIAEEEIESLRQTQSVMVNS